MLVTSGAHACRLAPQAGRHVGPRGVVAFAQDAAQPTQQYALQFFFDNAEFQVAKMATNNNVRPGPSSVELSSVI